MMSSKINLILSEELNKAMSSAGFIFFFNEIFGLGLEMKYTVLHGETFRIVVKHYKTKTKLDLESNN